MKIVVLSQRTIVSDILREKGEVITVPDNWNGGRTRRVLKRINIKKKKKRNARRKTK